MHIAPLLYVRNSLNTCRHLCEVLCVSQASFPRQWYEVTVQTGYHAADVQVTLEFASFYALAGGVHAREDVKGAVHGFHTVRIRSREALNYLVKIQVLI